MALTTPRHTSLSRTLSLLRFPATRSGAQWLLLLFLAACLFASTTSAASRTDLVYGPEETLVVDNSVPVLVNGEWGWVSEDDAGQLRKRQDGDDKKEKGKPTATLASPTRRGGDDDDEDPEPTPSGSTTRTRGETRDSPSNTKTDRPPSPLPSPFDNNLDYNFTSNGGKSCPRFLNTLLTSETFKSCYPLSVMLETSKSFFDAMKELQSIVTVLDATCAADIDFCTAYLASEAAAMITDEHCGEEHRNGQPNVVQAHVGLTSYNLLYKAGCLRRRRDGAPGDDGSYCFAAAATNTSTAANAYVYFLPLGMALPPRAGPACSGCLADTMAIYNAAAAARSLPVARTYEAAARRINEVCGPDFVNEALPEATDEGGAGRGGAVSGVAVGVALAVVVLGWV